MDIRKLEKRFEEEDPREIPNPYYKVIRAPRFGTEVVWDINYINQNRKGLYQRLMNVLKTIESIASVSHEHLISYLVDLPVEDFRSLVVDFYMIRNGEEIDYVLSKSFATEDTDVSKFSDLYDSLDDFSCVLRAKIDKELKAVSTIMYCMTGRQIEYRFSSCW